jgi:hypothetical protein
MDGDDSAHNLITLTVSEHAIAHKNLYEKHGKQEDYIAWKALSGQINTADIQLEKSRLGGKIASQMNIGSKRTAKQKANMSKSKLGHIRSEASKTKQSESVLGSKNHFYGKTHSDEFKTKQSENKKQNYIGSGNPNAKSVYYDGIMYDTMKDMYHATGISLYKIRKMKAGL